LLKPHDKARYRVLFRQADRLEDDAEQGHAHRLVARAGAQRAGRSVQATMALGLGAEFFQVVAYALWQVGNTPRGSTVVKWGIHPKCPQHLDQVRFTRAIEATDPNRGLFRLFDVLQVDVENVLKALFVLAIADECFELVP